MKINYVVRNHLKNCLSCRTGAYVIKQYTEFKKIKHKSGCASPKSQYCFDETEETLIQELASKLNIEGNIQEKYAVLAQLSERTYFNQEEEEAKNRKGICLCMLQEIILSSEDLYSELTHNKHLYSKDILVTMNKLNRKNLNNYDTKKIQSTEEKLMEPNLTDADKNSLKESISNYIFSQFCRISSLKFEDRNPESGECLRKVFLDTVNKDRTPEKAEYFKKRTEFFNRLDNLPKNSRDIIHAFIRKAPKKLGGVLQLVMENQNMSSHDVASILGWNASRIESLKKSSKSSLPSDELSNLCNALLISESVLESGEGKKYGNWQSLLNNETVKEFQISKELKTPTEIRKILRTDIKTLIEQSADDFHEMITTNPNLFYEEDFCIDDIDKCFDLLLHKDEAWTLLEILEEKKNNK